MGIARDTARVQLSFCESIVCSGLEEPATSCRRQVATVANISDMRFGYSPQPWEEMVEAGHGFLVSVASRHRLTTYTELCQVIRQRTGTEIDTGEFALNWLLGDISTAALGETNGALITSLVTYLDDNRPGDGFFVLAQSQGLLPGAPISRRDKDDFWALQVALVHGAYDQRKQV